MSRIISIRTVCGIVGIMCLVSCSSLSPVVTHPTKPGLYLTSDWKYEYKVWGDNLKHSQGILTHKGLQIFQPMGTVLDTPLGRFMSFDNRRGGQIGYNTGWLMTVFIHDTKRSNFVAPVFLNDGTINAEVLEQLPIKNTDIKEITIGQITSG